MAGNLGFFDNPQRVAVAVEERPDFSGLVGLSARNRVPAESSARNSATRDLMLCPTDRAEITYSGKRVQVLPGVKRASGAAVKRLLGIYKRAVLFLKEGESWNRIDDKEIVDLYENREAKAEFSSVPRLSRD